MSRRLNGRSSRQWVWVVGLALIGLAVTVGRSGYLSDTSSAPSATAESGEAVVLDLFESRRSGEMVMVEGSIERLLSDDNDGSRHQRFILQLSSGHTLLVAHNIDLAPRVPVDAGDFVRLRGQYEWNDQGGLLHWTHHDPDGDRAGGWIEVGGRQYR